MNRILVVLVLAIVAAGAACSSEDKDQAKASVEQIKDKTKEVAQEAAEKTKQVVSKTGEVISDGWITTKVKAKFADEKLLKDSDIDVETSDRVVTLKGTTGSEAARKQAVLLANGTEGVLRVVDDVKVKGK